MTEEGCTEGGEEQKDKRATGEELEIKLKDFLKTMNCYITSI